MYTRRYTTFTTWSAKCGPIIQDDLWTLFISTHMKTGERFRYLRLRCPAPSRLVLSVGAAVQQFLARFYPVTELCVDVLARAYLHCHGGILHLQCAGFFASTAWLANGHQR